jgi:acetamidase/formamidase
VGGQTHEFPTDRVHFTWDAGNEPVLTVASGDTVTMHTREQMLFQRGPGTPLNS